MRPYFQNKHATIYLGDNREFLADMEDDTAFATVTDPPYEVNLNPDTCPWDIWPKDWSQVYRTSAQYLVLMIAPHVAHARIPDVVRAGWNVLEVGFWVYGNGRPVNKTRLKRSYDLVYFMSKETREMFVENGRGHYKANSITGRKGAVNAKGAALGRVFHKVNSERTYICGQADYHPANVACEIESLVFGNSGYDLIFAVKRVRCPQTA